MVRQVTDAIGDVAARLKNWDDRRQDSTDLRNPKSPSITASSLLRSAMPARNFGTCSTVAPRAAPRNDPYPEDLRGQPYRHRNRIGRGSVIDRLPDTPFLRSLMISGTKTFLLPITPL